MTQLETLQNTQQLLFPGIALPAYMGADKCTHFRSMGLCRHRAKLSDADALIATVAKQRGDIQGVHST